MAASQPFAKLAVIGVGALLGHAQLGPTIFASVSLPLGELVDAVFHGLDRTRRARVRALCTCLADELAARAQGRDPGTVEVAKLEAERLVDGFGLSERRLVELGLDAGAAADELLQHSRFSRDERIELAPLCRDLLVCFYERLKEQHEFIQELLPDIYGRLLRDTASIRTDVAAVRQALEARSTLLPQPLPPRPELVGRGDELAGLVRLLLDGDPRPLLVWGGPGIGKTALTTAALHQPAIAARFGDRRYFVALREIRAGEQILDEVGRVIGEPDGEDRAARALRRLEAAGPALLVLDNLETPWETPEQGPATSRALGQLASLPRLRLMASIRGSQKPQGGRWRVTGEVPPLLPEDARELFCAVAGEEHRDDPALAALLTALGGVPLAISLMAQRMEDVADAAELLGLWRRERTRLAATGSGDQPDLSLHVSFETSLTSPRLPEAGRRLFALMGRLPLGVLPEDADTLLGGDGFAARSGLRHVGLAQQADGRLVMLPPVREHAAEKPLTPADEAGLTAWTFALVQAFGLLGEPRASRPTVERARAELVNLEAALPALNRSGPPRACHRPGDSPRPAPPSRRGHSKGC
jgi:hypothetical protein